MKMLDTKLFKCVGVCVAFIAVALQFGCTAFRPGTTVTSYTLSRKPLSVPIQYNVKRSERDIRHKSNFDMDFDVEIKKDLNSNYLFAVKNFVGKDIDDVQNRHLKTIAKVINQLKLSRSFSEFEPIGELNFVNFNPGGWAGMSVARSLGRYEPGFLDYRFQKEQVAIGSEWKFEHDLAKESRTNLSRDGESGTSIDEEFNIRQIGGEANYKLVRVDKIGNASVAEIEFHAKGDVITKIKSKIFGSSDTKESITEKGTYWINLDTGWPEKSRIVRTVETTWRNEKSTRVTTTITAKLWNCSFISFFLKFSEP